MWGISLLVSKCLEGSYGLSYLSSCVIANACYSMLVRVAQCTMATNALLNWYTFVPGNLSRSVVLYLVIYPEVRFVSLAQKRQVLLMLLPCDSGREAPQQCWIPEQSGKED